MIKLDEEKVLRDPIHGYVRVEDEVVWRCIGTREFQRLRRIHQLGSTPMVYHSGDHSRFSHCLGTYEIVRRMVSEVEDLKNSLSDYEKITVMLAGLLHDVGHAPFSHSFEKILGCNHEKYTIQLIRQDSEIHTVLRDYGEDLADDVASIIDWTHPNKILCQLVSSQLDADRMDYLLRDSYFTGTKYGEFDLERVLRTLRVADGRVVTKASGMHTIEDYIMARYHMYWQVYYHPVSRSYDTLLKMVFRRLVDFYQDDPAIAREYPMFRPLLEKRELNNQEYAEMDDSTCFYGFHQMEKGSDKILADLARRILCRDLFEYAPLDHLEEVREKLKQRGLDERYYLYTDHQSQDPYIRPYSDNDDHSICMLLNDGRIAELSTVSNIVWALTHGAESEDSLVFYPKEG